MNLLVQYIMLDSNKEIKFFETHNQKFRPMKGDIYFAKLDSGEIVQTEVTEIVTHPRTLPESKKTPLDILAYIS